uniref:Ankyrin repeat and SOCS box containing 13 n=1 Tax=Serinus canaria TaxID=9135 RepID=A0A8C9NEP1_SERCA
IPFPWLNFLSPAWIPFSLAQSPFSHLPFLFPGWIYPFSHLPFLSLAKSPFPPAFPFPVGIYPFPPCLSFPCWDLSFSRLPFLSLAGIYPFSPLPFLSLLGFIPPGFPFPAGIYPFPTCLSFPCWDLSLFPPAFPFPAGIYPFSHLDFLSLLGFIPFPTCLSFPCFHLPFLSLLGFIPFPACLSFPWLGFIPFSRPEFPVLCPGANVNAAKLHETALHHAAKVRNADLVELLVEFGGNIYARDNRGKKPSDYTWSSSPAAKCFEFYEKTPLSLAQLCRLAVRRAAGQRGLAKISQLQIPPRLIQYLSYN